MLTYPDRRRFEQIRARWESVLAGEDEPVDMVGRKVKHVTSQPPEGESNGGSRFRRKLSHGFAFLSKPLLQRKVTPGRTEANVPALAVTEPDTADTSITSLAEGIPLPSASLIPPPGSSDSIASDQAALLQVASQSNSTESAALPRPLQRSHTLSFIPRPVKSTSGSFSIDGGDTTFHTRESPVKSPVAMNNVVRSKIPSPSSPHNERRVLSPRQYHPPNTMRTANNLPLQKTFTTTENGSPRKTAIRSRTTPNLAKSAAPLPPAKRNVLATTAQSRTIKRSTLHENIPISAALTRKTPHAQVGDVKQESLAVPGVKRNRASLRPNDSFTPGKQSTLTLTTSVRKRHTSHVTQQTPVTAKRVHPDTHASTYVSGPCHDNDENRDAPPPDCLRTEESPSTATGIIDTEPLLPPHSTAHQDTRRRTLGTPNGLAGMWRTSRALAASNHEVRAFPRSQTFHKFGSQEDDVPPPVPPVPAQYRTPSLPFLQNASALVSRASKHVRKASDASSYAPIPEEPSNCDLDDDPRPFRSISDGSSTIIPTMSSNVLTAVRPVAPTRDFSGSFLSISTGPTDSRPSSSLRTQPWVISNYYDVGHANVEPHLQVKDYMPALYWAGRFQSRFDHWRTEAMIAELKPHEHQSSSPLGAYKLEQEDLAACHILNQLRDLCISDQAAASLWVMKSFCVKH